jgi:hypothetical protein
VLGALAVEEVLALGLGELVYLGTGESSKQFFGKLMLDRLACDGSLASEEAVKRQLWQWTTNLRCAGGPRTS